MKTTTPSAHAELIAIWEACRYLANTDLSDCTLYVKNGASFGNPFGSFYSDQEKRTVPFVQ